jgi:hypothetical protein
MAPNPKSDPLRYWFAGLVEQSFQTEVGLADPSLLDYIVELLARFVHVETIHQLDDGSGRRVEELAQMLDELQAPAAALPEARRRELFRHIGDFTLFWTGLYPEQLRRMRRRQSRDELLDYTQRGKRSYAIASDLSDDATRPPAAVLLALSRQFEDCVYGLGLVRRAWEDADRPGLQGIWPLRG